jgi:hypothetical protein
VQQHTLTAVIPIDDARAVDAQLKSIFNARFFDGLGVHFGRCVLLDDPAVSGFASSLVLETNFDSEIKDRDEATAEHVERLVRERGDALRRIIPGDLLPTLLESRAPSTAEYQGHPHRDLARIALEAKVHREALTCAHSLPAGSTDRELHTAVRKHVGHLLDLAAPAPPKPDPVSRDFNLRHRYRPWLRHFPVLGVGVFAAVGALMQQFFAREWDMQAEAETRGPERESLSQWNGASEDYLAQNALTHIVPLRPGLLARVGLEAIHRYLHALATHFFNDVEMLGGIPSIHFAKWMLVDEGRRLLFLSNYDGSWESYLGDFVDGAAIGLNLAWMCTEQYPRTLLASGGANDEQRFKSWARAHQRPTPYFYSAYPSSTVTTINNATWVRHGLHRTDLTDQELAAWRRRLT